MCLQRGRVREVGTRIVLHETTKESYVGRARRAHCGRQSRCELAKLCHLTPHTAPSTGFTIAYPGVSTQVKKDDPYPATGTILSRIGRAGHKIALDLSTQPAGIGYAGCVLLKSHCSHLVHVDLAWRTVFFCFAELRTTGTTFGNSELVRQWDRLDLTANC